MSKAKSGVYAAAITPLDKHGEPDAGKLARYCQWCIGQGLDGVAPLGSTGEGNSLPLSFRTTVPKALADVGLTTEQVIMGTGSCAAGDAIAATRASVDAGFYNVLVLPPFYYKNASETGVFNYYAKLIEAIADDRLRVYLYHFPQLSMTPITHSLIRRLRETYGEVISGLKDSSGDFNSSLAFIDVIDDFDVFPSNEGVLLEGLGRGCAGVISATTNASAALSRLTLTATGEQAIEHQATLTAVRAAIAKHPLSAAVKQVHAWRSGDDSWTQVLPPNVVLTKDQTRELHRDLLALEDKAGVLGQSMEVS